MNIPGTLVRGSAIRLDGWMKRGASSSEVWRLALGQRVGMGDAENDRDRDAPVPRHVAYYGRSCYPFKELL